MWLKASFNLYFSRKRQKLAVHDSGFNASAFSKSVGPSPFLIALIFGDVWLLFTSKSTRFTKISSLMTSTFLHEFFLKDKSNCTLETRVPRNNFSPPLRFDSRSTTDEKQIFVSHTFSSTERRKLKKIHSWKLNENSHEKNSPKVSV